MDWSKRYTTLKWFVLCDTKRTSGHDDDAREHFNKTVDAGNCVECGCATTGYGEDRGECKHDGCTGSCRSERGCQYVASHVHTRSGHVYLVRCCKTCNNQPTCWTYDGEPVTALDLGKTEDDYGDAPGTDDD